MTTEQWEPVNNSADNNVIDPTFLKDLLARLKNHKKDELHGLISPDEEKNHRHLIKQSTQAWNKAMENYDNEDIIAFIRFFTLAEMQLHGWDAGTESAVISLAKILRKRGAPLEKKWLLWIKQNSSNKFLPNGAL